MANQSKEVNLEDNTSRLRVYVLAISIIVVTLLGFSAVTTYVTYPTNEHRSVAQKIAKLDAKAFSLGEKYETVTNSDAYVSLISTTDYVYSTRMAVGSGVLSGIISIAIIVALYRYLRRNRITDRPIAATVTVYTVATALLLVPSVIISEWITGIHLEYITITFLLFSAPLAIGFTAAVTYVIARVAAWQYNRAHGFNKE